MHEPALNLERLTDLLGDDRESIVEILDLAIGTCRKALETLRSLGPESPAPAIEHAAHAMKGAAANVGAEALSAVAALLEDEARRADIADFDGSVARIKTEFDRFENAVHAYEAEPT